MKLKSLVESACLLGLGGLAGLAALTAADYLFPSRKAENKLPKQESVLNIEYPSSENITYLKIRFEDINQDGLQDIALSHNKNKDEVYYAYEDKISGRIEYSRHREIEH